MRRRVRMAVLLAVVDESVTAPEQTQKTTEVEEGTSFLALRAREGAKQRKRG